MSNSLNISLIQTDIIWHDITGNLKQLTSKVDGISDGTDLIVLPEMFTTGFSMSPETISETMSGSAVRWMKKMAKSKSAAITGSLIIQENGHYFNRFLFVFPSGEIEYYDKRHLFSLAGEHEVYKQGSEKRIVNYKGWKICPLICYDLRFPVWSRNTEAYDLLIYVANWPKPRIHAWDTLLQARAIENMCYSIGVNRVGKDDNDLEYIGHSSVYNSLGETISEKISISEAIITVEIQKDHLTTTRSKLNFLGDRDDFSIG